MRQAKTWHNFKQRMAFKKGNLFDLKPWNILSSTAKIQ